MTRQEFYKKVVDLASDKDISRTEAYEIIEQQHLKKHKRRRYVSYRSWYHVNYREMVRELRNCRNSSRQTKELNDLCGEFLQGKLTQEEMVERIKQML
jgi:hypothetical protein